MLCMIVMSYNVITDSSLTHSKIHKLQLIHDKFLFSFESDNNQVKTEIREMEFSIFYL